MNPFDALLVGEALIDRFPSGDVVGGAPLNVARHLQALGCAALLVSRVGVDADGAQVEASLRAAGLSLQGLQRDATHRTGVVRIEPHSDGGHGFRIASDTAWDQLDVAALPTLAQPPRVLVFGSLAQRGARTRAAIRALLATSPALRFLDLNLRQGVTPELALECLRLADWAKLNDEELAQVLRWTGQPDAQALCAHLALRRLIVTRGANGYVCVGDAPAQGGGVPAQPFVDTVGAGDAFSAALLAAHLQGKGWQPALQWANRFAAALCGERGPAPADPAAFYPPWLASLHALPDAP